MELDIHGTKPEFGPTHDKEDKRICADGCETCANRVFSLHTSFFVSEFKKKVTQQHGEIACKDDSCGMCNQKPWEVVCVGCAKETGKVRTGVLACEILQQHPGNAKCATIRGPVKRCGCTVHVKCWLLCSQACLLGSKYAKAVPDEDRPKFEELFAQQRFSVPAMGPLLVHAEYTGKDLTAEELKLVCGGCGKRDAPKVCSACSRARYCSVECQKGAWREHKPACKRLTEAELADLAKPPQNHESLTATD
jgi:hypothetical protein